jgi:hypothetical protein
VNGRGWSQSELRLVKKLYPDRRTTEIAKLLKRGVYSVYNAAHKLGLKKSQEYIERYCRLQKGQTHCGVSARFKKGQVPANKGLKRPGWHAGRMKETQFKKGERSGIAAKNWVPIGTILPDAEGYLRIKVRAAEHGKEPTGFGNMKCWPLYNRYLWELHKGPIPPRHTVIFKDGDRSNCAIENLELLSMADNMRRNSIWKRMPPELIQVILLNGALKRRIRRLNGKEQSK